MIYDVLLYLSLSVISIAFILVYLRLKELKAKYELLNLDNQALLEKYKDISDAREEKQQIQNEIEAERKSYSVEREKARLEFHHATQEVYDLKSAIARLREELKSLDEEANLQSFGFYQPRYEFSSSEEYQSALLAIRSRQKLMIQSRQAAVSQTEWTVNGSRTEGKKQTNQTLRLLLRAFNGESDAAIAKVRYNNILVMESRIFKSFEAINKMAGVQQCHIAYDYLSLKLEELRLAHEFYEKVQEEKEEQRRIRDQIREEELVRREIEKALLDTEREERIFTEALRKAQEDVEKMVGEKQQKLYAEIEELQCRLREVQAKRERAISRAQMTRSGHVYVISNIGSFGENLFKIGMTRRLEPLDRIRELGDASVPFQFDVHAMIFSEDAPALESKLHRMFNKDRVNLVNTRKEFFSVALDEIASAVRHHHGEITITRCAEAIEYRKTQALRGKFIQGQPGDTGVQLPSTVPTSYALT